MNKCFYRFGIRCLKFNSRPSKKDCHICTSYKAEIDVNKAINNILDKINKNVEDDRMRLTINNLESCFNKAWDEGFKYVGVKIAMDGFRKEEVIINSYENFGDKLKYYKNAYNEDLTLKNAPDKVKIVGFTYGNSFSQIEKDLLGISNKTNKNSLHIDVKMNIDEADIEKIAKEAHEKLIDSLQRNIRIGI